MNRLAGSDKVQRIAVAAFAFGLWSCSGSSNPLTIKTLSNRADLISGGEALVEIVLHPGTSASGLKVDVGGHDVSGAFVQRADGRVIGLITGLANGNNVVTAKLGAKASLTINNHPIGGPVFSGTQIQPWICATPTAQPPTATMPATQASGLSTFAIDAQCNIATEYKFFYKTTASCDFTLNPDPSPPATPAANVCFKPYNPDGETPSDLAMTTTDIGVRVPYILRVERGTINRGIYDIAVLFDPTAPWKPYAPQPRWNRKLLYVYGASTNQPRVQSRPNSAWFDATADAALSRGFMVAVNMLTDSQLNSNRVVAAETTMMMKEHIVNAYGEIRYTIGTGCSGGSLLQNTIASIYPGLVNGLQVACTYPDSETTGIEVGESVLLVNYFRTPEFIALTMGLPQAEINAKKAAIAGHLDQTGCMAWNNLFGNGGKPGQFIPYLVVDLDTGRLDFVGMARNNCQLLPSQVYDPISNPNGYRCGAADHAVAIWGTQPGTNFARVTRDNVGVQYGLEALTSGAITAEEFVTLNEKIGGFDIDANLSPTRMVADADALTTAYVAGIVSDGHNLAKVPIIDVRGFDDSLLTGPFGIHHTWRSFSLRERLDKANGNHDNLVLWRFPTPLLAPPAFTLQSFQTMDKWLANIEADTSDIQIEQKVVKNKPADASDFCYLTGDTMFRTKITDQSICDADPRLKAYSSPRQIAGGPLSENVLKCQLKPFNAADYNVTFSADQLARLQLVFPNGVCDWSKPGVNQQPANGPLTFEGGPGGVPLGPAPTSTSL
jgi:hypothetical protein